MTIPRRYLHALDVISVLLFSLLANYVLTLNIDFRSSIDYAAVEKLVLLSISSIVLYGVVVRLRQIDDYSRAEYAAETSIERQAKRSIDDRYRDYYLPERSKITASILIATSCGIGFFFLQPIVQLIK